LKRLIVNGTDKDLSPRFGWECMIITCPDLNKTTKMEIGIRGCTVADFREIFTLLKQLWPGADLRYENLENVFRAGLDSELNDYAVAECEGKIVGFCSLSVMHTLWSAGRMGHIDELVIAEGFRGKGIGTQLLNEMSRRAREKGCLRIELESDLRRSEAHRFYVDRGFKMAAYSFWKEI